MASSAVAQDPKKTEKVNKRVDWKKQKELEEARKAGTAPPEVDEEGRYYLQSNICFSIFLLHFTTTLLTLRLT